jgi:hypothetical protein
LGQIAQLAFEHFSVGVFWQSFDEHVSLGALEASDACKAPGIELRRVRAVRILCHHKGHDSLAPLGVRLTHHGNLGYASMLQQHLFHFARVDVGAAADDEVFAPVFERDEAIFILAAHVARP